MLDQKKNKGDFHPYLGNSDVRWGRFDLTALSSMRFESDEHERYGLRFGDLVVCEGGEPGRAAIWRDEIPGMKIQKALHRIRAKSEFDNNFLYYWFLLAGQTGLLEPYFTGTTIKHLPGQALVNLQVPKPDIEIQHKIVKILGTLDDKIELNRRINRTLEEMAQALFKSWFVDFDPVKAKASVLESGGTSEEAEQAAMQIISGKTAEELETFRQSDPNAYADLAHTASLFPSRLVESELGQIPEGWAIETLASMIDFNPKYALKKGALSSYLDMKNVPTQGSLAGEVIQREFGSGTKFSNGDTLLARITPCLENGKTAFVDFLNDGEVGWGSTEFIVMRPKEGLPASIGYLIARLDTFRSIAIQSMTGSSGRQRAEAGTLATARWLRYPDGLLHALDRMARKYLDAAKSNGKEIESLTALRDSLLPKLLSGELEIPDELISEVAA
jgi:type I restriction enzyme S subunit